MNEPPRCIKCNVELLNDQDIVWLELDQRTMTYVNPEKNPVPAEFSQGSFPFGSACAKLELWKAQKEPVDDATN